MNGALDGGVKRGRTTEQGKKEGEAGEVEPPRGLVSVPALPGNEPSFHLLDHSRCPSTNSPSWAAVGRTPHFSGPPFPDG